MTIGMRLVRWRWQAYVALTVLAALLLPATSEAACLQAASAPPSVAISFYQASPGRPVAQDAPKPTDKPASRPRHAAICQHAHCGHPQTAPDTSVELATMRLTSPIHSSWTYDRLAESTVIAGPERPPQA